MEDLYRPCIIRFSQVHTVIDELNGIDSYQIKVSEDARFGQGRNIHTLSENTNGLTEIT